MGGWERGGLDGGKSGKREVGCKKRETGYKKEKAEHQAGTQYRKSPAHIFAEHQDGSADEKGPLDLYSCPTEEETKIHS